MQSTIKIKDCLDAIKEVGSGRVGRGALYKFEDDLVAYVTKGGAVASVLLGMDGFIEISRCGRLSDGSILRVEDLAESDVVVGTKFWAVYAHQTEGGVACVADLTTKKKAEAFAAGLYVAWLGFSAVVRAAQAVLVANTSAKYIKAIAELDASVENLTPASRQH
jgi:hypothetical protein